MKEFSRIRHIQGMAEAFRPYGHYVIDEDTLVLAASAKWPAGDCSALPFPTTAIEYRGDNTGIFIFVTASSADSYELTALIWRPDAVAYLFEKMTLSLIRNTDDSVAAHRMSAGDWEFEGLPHYELDEDFKNKSRTNIAAILQRFLYLRSVKGIEDERVEAPEKLNKKRLAHGKPAIQPYIRLVVGQVYDHEGNEIPEHERRHVRPHIRAGHSRRQHHGPQNSLLKTVHIPPTVVNYGAGDILPDRPRVFVLAKEKRHVMALGESIH